MQKSLLGLFLFISTSLFAQQKITKAALNGKWVVAAMMYNGAYHNFETDSTGYSPEAKAKMKTKADSIKIASKNEMFFEMVKGSSYVFDPTGMYLDIDPQKNIAKGTYTYNEATGMIVTLVNKKSITKQAWLSGTLLSFRDVKNQNMIFYCKKAVK